MLILCQFKITAIQHVLDSLVPNNRLIYKIKEEYGLSEDLTDWVKYFLSRRKKRVVLGEIKSEWRVAYHKDL